MAKKRNKIEAGKFKQRKLSNDDFIFLLKTFLQKNDLTYTYYYINLVEAIIRHQRLRLTCKESPRFCTTFKDQRELLTSEVIFGVTRYECFTVEMNEIKTFRNCNLKKQEIEPHQSFTLEV